MFVLCKMPPGSEYRIDVGEKRKSVIIQLLLGIAFIDGVRMVRRRWYTFPSYAFISIFTVQGCCVKVSGHPSHQYFLPDPFYRQYGRLHGEMERRRFQCRYSNCGRRVTLFIGPYGTGKKHAVKTVLNLAVDSCRYPYFIDLNAARNSVSIPGTMTFVHCTKSSHIVDGYEDIASQVYFYGFLYPHYLPQLYILLMKSLRKELDTFTARSSDREISSGVIINGSGLACDQSFINIFVALSVFDVNHVVIMGNNPLLERLRRFLDRTIDIHFIPNSTEPNEKTRLPTRLFCKRRIKRYFHGLTKRISHYIVPCEYQTICIVKIRLQDRQARNHFIRNAFVHDLKVENVPLSPHLKHKILAQSFATQLSEVVTAPIVRFVCVTEVNGNTLHFLSRVEGPFTGQIFIMGDIPYNTDYLIP